MGVVIRDGHCRYRGGRIEVAVALGRHGWLVVTRCGHGWGLVWEGLWWAEGDDESMTV